MALETSPEAPIPVRQVSRLIGEWIDRLGPVWVEGEVAQLNRRPGSGFVFLTLRDPEAAMSLTVTCGVRVLDAVQPPLSEGARIVVSGRPSWYAGRGTLSLAVSEIRPVGLGELLARLEQLKQMLAAEGLFADSRKRPLPFLPRTIGLISGRGSAAERDVLENAKRRWPGARFRVESTPVQGAAAVPAIVDALARLADDPEVDVVVIARGGGSVEDLLPFSDETLLRAVSDFSLPVVSAIGHEQDAPLLDLVADVRASTPTDAARRIVPDLEAELAGLLRARQQMHRSLDALLHRERTRLSALRDHPVLRSADAVLSTQREHVARARARSHEVIGRRVERARLDLTHQRQRLHLLSPASTLDRGYAIVRLADGAIVRDPSDVPEGAALKIRVAGGSFDAQARPRLPS
jgi:exodeoxyribonuclease VII large subunit